MVRLFSHRNAAAILVASRGSAFPCSTNIAPLRNLRSIHQYNRVVEGRTFHQLSRPFYATNEDIDHVQSKKKIRSKSSVKKKSKKKKLFRADKVLSSRASLSRSQAFDALKRRRIAFKRTNCSEIIPIKGPKEKLEMDAILFMDGKPIPELPPILIAYHKPKFMLSAMDEKHSNKKHLGMILPDNYKKLGIHPVGRLDYDTSGLLLFSRDGELTQRLLHPKHSVEKEYVATVSGKVDVQILKDQLENEGVITGEGKHFAKLLEVDELDFEESKTILGKILQAEGLDDEEANVQNFEVPLTNVRIAVQEGKYRMVRRMLANCKHPVVELRRERHGSIELSELKVGHFRHCKESEIEWAEGLLSE